MNKTHYILPPEGMADVILDTDAYNEVDDQFAICQMVLSPEKFNVKGICAAPFFNDRSCGPLDGMEKSYDEIVKLLGFMNKEKEYEGKIFKGSPDYLEDEKTPRINEGTRFIADTAKGYSEEKPLYVVTIGAITNVASALLISPEIADRIVVVWLGGHGRDFRDTREFNMYQDIAAARAVFSSGARVVQLPCMGVVSELSTTVPELDFYLKGKNPLCDYLADIVRGYCKNPAPSYPWSKVIWDVSAVAWFFNRDEKMMMTRCEQIKLPSYSGVYENNTDLGLMEYVYCIKRDNIFKELFGKLTNL